MPPENWVKMCKGSDEKFVHPANVDNHKRAGWKLMTEEKNTSSQRRESLGLAEPAGSRSASEPEAEVESVPMIDVEPEVEPEPEIAAEPEIELKVEVDPEPEPEIEPETELKVEVEPEPEVKAPKKPASKKKTGK